MLEQCKLCPHNCKVNRTNGEIGRCKCNDQIKIALVSLHKFEEPCISGINGSGTVFFSNCNLNCMFCQNYEISHLGKGYEITVEELAKIANTINYEIISTISFRVDRVYINE